MGVKESRLGRILDVFRNFGKSMSAWLKSVDVDDLSVAEAVRVVNKEAAQNGDAGISDKAHEAMDIATELSQVRADLSFNREDAIGPVFTAAENPDKDADKELADKLNAQLKDETLTYVEGNPIELKEVEPAKLHGKGGKERERIK